MKNLWIWAAAVGAACASAVPALSATAPTFYIVQKDAFYTQSGPSTPTLNGFQFKGRATPNDGVSNIAFDGGTITFPAASPLPPSALGPVGVELDYKSALVDQATFQTDYPDAVYKFHLTDSANAAHTEDASVDTSLAAMPSVIPALTGTSFNALQGMDPTKSFTFNWNSFTGANPNALIFFFVTNSSGGTVFSDGLQPNVTQDTISANLLQPGQQYNYIVFFSNVSVVGNGETLQDARTTGSFVTAPEPSGLLLCGLGVGGLMLRRRNRAAR
jgi:hypothetical protein